MTIKTILLPVDKAAFIQKNAAEYGCNLVEIGAAGKNEHTLTQYAKVTVSGDNESVKKLFDQIGVR